MPTSSHLAPPGDSSPSRSESGASARSAAIVAGVSYVALFVLGVFANFAVRMQLVVPGDAAATYDRVVADEFLLRVGVVAFLAIFLLDVVVAWALWRVFRPVGAAAATVSAALRLVYTVMLGVGIVELYRVLRLVGSGPDVAGAPLDGRARSVFDSFESFNAAWMVGLLAFGVHVVLVGVQLGRARWASPIAAGVVVLAGVAYVVDTLAFTLLSDYADHADLMTALVAAPALAGEAVLTIWLFRRGGTFVA